MKLQFCALALMLYGCSQTPVVSNPDEAPGAPNSGKFPALTTLLEAKTSAVIILLHGVGDHCRGYALDDTDGWLNKNNQNALNLQPTTPSAAPPIAIYDSEFLPGHPRDEASKVLVSTREYVLTLSPTGGTGTRRLPVIAIEITWSQLTQWIKTTQLNFDLTERVPSPRPSHVADGCPYADMQKYKPPLSRELINRGLKEGLLDRSLADAMLYAGSYGRVMRRGVAEGLCRGLKGTKNAGGQLCSWPTISSDTAYFFVTHSLGSRMLYDTLLDLSDPTIGGGTFSDDEISNSQVFLISLIANTASAYLMANQLPMLGLANEDGTHTSTEGPIPLGPSGQGDGAAFDPTLVLKAPIIAFGSVHWRITGKPLPFVAFSDQNDQLSWGIPRWYVRNAAGPRPGIDFTNVYIKNSTHYPPLYADAAGAHSNYFVNRDVWRAIRCGAEQGKVNKCP